VNIGKPRFPGTLESPDFPGIITNCFGQQDFEILYKKNNYCQKISNPAVHKDKQVVIGIVTTHLGKRFMAHFPQTESRQVLHKSVVLLEAFQVSHASRFFLEPRQYFPDLIALLQLCQAQS